MMAMLTGVCATVFVLSAVVFIACCVIATKAQDINVLGAVAYGVLALPVAIASGVLGVLFWWFS